MEMKVKHTWVRNREGKKHRKVMSAMGKNISLSIMHEGGG